MAFNGYLKIAGNPNFQTDINPSVLYNNSGQYLRVDYNWDIVGMCQVLVAGTYNDNWFSNEKYIYNPLPYWNFGNTTGLMEGYYNSDTNPFFTVDKGLVTHFENGSQTGIRQVSGNPFGNNNIQFFAGYGDATVHTRFYGFKISDAQGNVLVNFVADPQGIKDEVSGKVYNMTGSGTFEYVSLHIFNPDTNSVRFDQTGGTATVNVEAETTWDIAYDSDWFTVVKNGDSVTISAPINDTTERKEMEIIFTDADDYTFIVTVKQKGVQNGMPLHLGELEIPTLMLGSTPITAAYLGEQQVFSNGPFIGLKVTSSVSVFKSKPTATIKVKSSEGWITGFVADWFTLDQRFGDAGTTEITLTCTKTDDESATAEITFIAGLYEAVCTVKYMAFNENAYLEVVNTSDVSNDTWYVDLEYVPNANTIIKMNTENITVVRADGYQAILSSSNADTDSAVRWRFHSSVKEWYYAFGGPALRAGKLDMTTKHSNILSKEGWNCDGTLMPVGAGTTNLQNVTTLTIGCDRKSQRSTQGKFGAITICEGSLDNVVHRFIPETGGFRDAETGVLHPITIVRGDFEFSVGEW